RVQALGLHGEHAGGAAVDQQDLPGCGQPDAGLPAATAAQGIAAAHELHCTPPSSRTRPAAARSGVLDQGATGTRPAIGPLTGPPAAVTPPAVTPAERPIRPIHSRSPGRAAA